MKREVSRRSTLLVLMVLLGFLLVLIAAVVMNFVLPALGEWTPRNRDTWYETPLDRRIDAALGRAARFLGKHQSDDGRFVSGRYGALRGDPALTAMAGKALAFGGASPGETEAAERALLALDGTLADPATPMNYPVYTLSLAILLATKVPGDRSEALKERLLARLRTHQLAEPLGWGPADAAYGGFGYSRTPPHRPPAGSPPPPFDSDLSSTVFAVGALRTAGVPADDSAIVRALVFVRRCQNFPPDGTPEDPAFDDGGFFFTPTNDIQNKAGVAGADAAGRRRYRSYGSMTADGLRALVRCGLSPEHPRARAALRWLSDRFEPGRNPGVFDEARENERASSRYYWCWSFAHAMRLLGLTHLERGGDRFRWAEWMASTLLAEQEPDGSWTNPATQVMEDDPLVATSFAAGALGICRILL